MKKSILIHQLVTVILFLACVGLPLFQNVTHVFPSQKLEGENRALAEKPKMDVKQLDKFPPQFTAFYNDHFPFRAFFFEFDYRIFIKKSPIKHVIIGKNNWLFSGGEALELYQGLIPYSDQEVKHTVENLEARRKKYEAMGIKFYIAIAPTAFEIYPENLPLYILRVDKTLTDVFCEELQNNSNIPFVYLKKTLLENKTEGQLFQRYDPHWNELGAYFAYNATLNLIKKDFPEIPVYPLNDFELTPEFNKKGSLLNMLSDRYKNMFDDDIRYQVLIRDRSKDWFHVEKAGYPIPEKFPYPGGYEIVTESPFKELPRILVFRDSFFNTTRLYAHSSFSRSLVIWDNWEFRENMDIVLNEKPNIVLLFLYEVHVPHLLSNNDTQ
jgi:hypothetical protein